MRFIRSFGPLALGALALGACEPAKYALKPLEEAKYQPPPPLVREVTAPAAPQAPLPAEPVRIGESYWQPAGVEHVLPATYVRPVATVDGAMFYALAWDTEPFDRLLVPAAGRPGAWSEFAEVY